MSGLYIHIPFCRKKCHYCDFHFAVSMKYKNELINALVKEMAMRKSEIISPLESIYFGGGTPSVLSENDLNIIFDSINKNFQIVKYPEITLEANPDDLSIKYLKMLKKIGINRLSIGIQSFHDDELQMMNRSHNAIQAKNAVLNAKNVGFDNITIDLIYGIPNSNDEKWNYNLKIFSELDIPHLSAYALTVEEKTALDVMIRKGKMKPVDEELALNQFEVLRNFVAIKGMEHYEISNFAKPDCYSKHNTSYWQNKPYLGIGPSSHSYDGNKRSWNISNNAKYIKSLEISTLPLEFEVLTEKEKFNEYLMTGLRTKWGINLSKIELEFGIKTQQKLLENAQNYLDKKIIERKDDFLMINPEKYFYSDGIIADLFQ